MSDHDLDAEQAYYPDRDDVPARLTCRDCPRPAFVVGFDRVTWRDFGVSCRGHYYTDLAAKARANAAKERAFGFYWAARDQRACARDYDGLARAGFAEDDARAKGARP